MRTALALTFAGTLTALALPAAARAQEHSHAAPAAKAPALSPALAKALAAPNRDADRQRDVWRHPGETLAFFRVEPDMKVGEYAPGGGWYSRVLGNYLSTKGRIVGLFSSPGGDAKARDAARAAAAAYPAQVHSWTGREVAGTQGLALDAASDADRGSFDRILVMRMMHNMIQGGHADSELKALRDLLKRGGMLAIEQHRAPASADDAYSDGSKGYLRQADVIRLVESAGFELVASSEINANPRDTADHPGGVWEMQPTWRTKRPELEKLGESDRMTLLFRKR